MFVPKGQVDNKKPLVSSMAWCQTDGNELTYFFMD